MKNVKFTTMATDKDGEDVWLEVEYSLDGDCEHGMVLRGRPADADGLVQLRDYDMNEFHDQELDSLAEYGRNLIKDLEYEEQKANCEHEMSLGICLRCGRDAYDIAGMDG